MKFRIVVLLALILLTGIFTPKPENTTDPEHPFAKHLTSLYVEYLDAAKQGDVQSVSDKVIATYFDIFSEISPELLKTLCESELDPRVAHFIKVDANGNTARIVYMKDIEDKLNWQAVVFKLDSGRWKIARIVRYAKDKDSEEDTLALLLEDTKSLNLVAD